MQWIYTILVFAEHPEIKSEQSKFAQEFERVGLPNTSVRFVIILSIFSLVHIYLFALKHKMTI